MTGPLSLPELADLLALMLRATLLLGAAWAAAAALRKAGASAAARHMAWFLGIVALLVLPVLWYLVPALRLPILPAEAATASAAASPALAPPAFGPAGAVFPDAPDYAGWVMVLLAAYALGAAALLLRLIVGRRMLRRLWNEADRVTDPGWEKLLSQLSSAMGLSRPVELRISGGPAVPMTWGTLAPKVLLPAGASEWPPERRRLVLLHELAHVARLDSFSRSAASLACALYWIHPGMWFAARQMRMEQEHAADDRVLMAGGSAQAYALSLLHLARGAGARPQFDQAAAMAGMYQLERRLVSITSPARRNRPGRFFLSSSALFAGLTTLLVATGVPVSASLPPSPFRARGTDMAGPVETGVVSRPAEELSPRLAGRVPPAAGPGTAIERSVRESAIASESRAGAPASPAAEYAERPRPREATVATGDGSVSQGKDGRPGQPPPHSQQLRDYGWELRRDSKVQIGSQGDSSRPTRLALPAPLDSASSERTGRPRWARNAPRLVQGAPPTGSPASASRGPLMLSWSLEVAGK